MSSNWAIGLPRWQPYVDENGQIYSLAHLHPHRRVLHFEQRGAYAACDIELQIGYSSHPFTRKCDDGVAGYAAFSKPHDQRAFCPERYRYSLKLRQVMDNIESRRCYATERRNFFVVETMDELPQETEYWVFFNPKPKGPTTLQLFVESAYAGDTRKAPRSRRGESVVFKALVAKALDLKKQTPP